ncbi:MAG: hypothetical protein IT546_06530 [Caulobacteraceae bacterium]|nr:hypothetical protein [Caulobacteraceae bacterium]
MPDLYSPAVVERLRALVSEADAGGPPQPWNVEDFLRQAHERLDREAK